MKNLKTCFKDIFLFKPKTPKALFILEEPPDQSDADQDREKEAESESEEKEKHEEKDLETEIKEKSEEKKDKDIPEEDKSSDKKEKHKKTGKKGIIQPKPIVKKEDEEKEEKIHSSYQMNLDTMKERYNADINGDFKVRDFKICIQDEIYKAFICFFDGMVDRTLVNTIILQPMMTVSTLPLDTKGQSVREVVYNHLVPQNQINICKTYQEVVDEVNFGGVGIFIEGVDVAFAADLKGWAHRNIEKPTSELNIRGPRESFNEINRMGTALIRKIIKDENLIVEDVAVGTRSKTPCSMVYIKNIANDSLVREIRRRLKNIKIGYLRDSGELEQLLEDDSYLPSPQMLLTERPDRVAAYLGEGRVGIVVHGSPFVIVAPVTFFNLVHSPEDYYIRYPYATLLRVVRIIGIIFTLLLPSLYLAITNFHHEMLPTDLLLAIASSREKVPFPTIVGILIMEISFELIREAGIRIPGPIGPTLGIVGALILGQAAVAANLVSPILIIIVAVTGIGSFAIPDFSLGYSFRALRFAYLILASFAGLLGIALGVFIHLMFLVHAKSFGVPFLVPLAPKTSGKHTNTIMKTPLWKEEDRPDFLNPKDVKQQPHISKQWAKKGAGSDETES